MDASNLITGAVHAVSGRFSYYWDLAEWLQQRYRGIPYQLDVVRRRLNEDIRQMTRPRDSWDRDSALEYLIASDLEQATRRAEFDKLPTSDEGFHKRIKAKYVQAIEILSKLGFKFPVPEFFIVEQFPEPYHKMDWVAFVSDEADLKKYGIRPAIYLLESELSPYYTELTLAHELVHVAIANGHSHEDHLHGRGLEEGIAEIIGTLYIGEKLYSPEIAHNVFIHSRLSSSLSQANTLYLDYTRLAFLFYRRFGLLGMTQLMREGREKIKKVEALCLSEGIGARALRFKRGKWDKRLSYLLDSLLLGSIPNLVVSPLAAYVSRSVRRGRTVEEIATAARVDVESTKEALEEIQERTCIILLDNNRVDFSDLPFIEQSKTLRYEVTTHTDNSPLENDSNSREKNDAEAHKHSQQEFFDESGCSQEPLPSHQLVFSGAVFK
jgi:hypothetical protein